ncbi:MAG: MFS transporter [Halioglobus sp.]
MKTGFSNVWLLALVNSIAMSASPLMMLIGSIIGTHLAPSAQWATLPIALMVIGTATGVIPAARCMARLGRKPTFLLFITLGVAACLLGGHALSLQNFPLFCLSSMLLGVTNAALQQIRFAAMECVPIDKGPTAASVIMCAGIISAFLGPELAVLGRDLSAVEYRGSFWLAAACMVVGGLLMMFYTPAPPRVGHSAGEARPLGQMLQNPALRLAIVSAAVGFVVMAFIMTATPISMHVHQGHNLEDTKWVIQSHIAAMFLPSLLTVWLFRVISVRGLMIAGLTCFSATIVIGLIDASVMGYWGQLVMLGIGWNFLFVSGTALLPTAHEPGEQYRAQALNDSVVFSSQAIASLSAGFAMSLISWQTMLLLCAIPMVFMSTLIFRNNGSGEARKL